MRLRGVVPKAQAKSRGFGGMPPEKKSKSRWKSVQFCAFLLTKKYFFKREKNINQEKRYIAWLGGGFREPWKPPLDPAMCNGTWCAHKRHLNVLRRFLRVLALKSTFY